MARVRYFYDLSVDHRQIRCHRNAVVQETGIFQHTLVVENVFLIQGPANALGSTALHLTFNIGGVNGPARVLNGGEAQHIDLACLGINSQIAEVHREGCSSALGIQRGSSRNRTAGLTGFARKLRQA